jgi:hypothetical protein
VRGSSILLGLLREPRDRFPLQVAAADALRAFVRAGESPPKADHAQAGGGGLFEG